MSFKLTMLVMIGTDCTGSCKSNDHTIMSTMAPVNIQNLFNCIWLDSQRLMKSYGTWPHTGCCQRYNWKKWKYVSIGHWYLFHNVSGLVPTYVTLYLNWYLLMSHCIWTGTHLCHTVSGLVPTYVTLDQDCYLCHTEPGMVPTYVRMYLDWYLPIMKYNTDTNMRISLHVTLDQNWVSRSIRSINVYDLWAIFLYIIPSVILCLITVNRKS